MRATSGGKQVEPEQAIPHQVVFLAPRARPCRTPAGNGRRRRPASIHLRGELLRGLAVCRSLGRSPRQLGTACAYAPKRHDGLDREVGVVRQMAREVVGAELILRDRGPSPSDTRPTCVKCGQYVSANSALPSLVASASARISMLPLSSTGIWLSSFCSPPPYTWPLACGYVPRSCGANGKLPAPHRARSPAPDAAAPSAASD